MQTVNLKAHVGDDGILKLEVPTDLSAQDVEVVLMFQAAGSDARDENGWPIGFFDRSYGALADIPMERPPQPPLKSRDPIE